MHALNLQPKTLSLAERLADLAVDALIDEADLSPKPALVDRRGNGAHTDLHLGLMHASALALWPAFKEMAEAAIEIGEVGLPLREALGRIGREGEQAMLATTNGVNTHRGAIWALGPVGRRRCAGAAIHCSAGAVALRAARLALLDDRYAPRPLSHGAQVAQRYGARGAREEAQLGFPAVTQRALPQLKRSRAAGHGEQNARLDALAGDHDQSGRHLRAVSRRRSRACTPCNSAPRPCSTPVAVPASPGVVVCMSWTNN